MKRGLTGVVYGLGDGRMEIVSEGKRIDKFVEWVSQFVTQECVGKNEACEVATVKARDLSAGGAMYSSAFPVVNFDVNSRRVRIGMKGDKQQLDYTLRHTKIEAGYNRKLEYTSTWLSEDRLDIIVSGAVPQLKSFVRWCKRGPPMHKPESVSIHWVEDTVEAAKVSNTAFRDEGVGL